MGQPARSPPAGRRSSKTWKWSKRPERRASCSLAGGEHVTRGFWVTRARNHNGADQHAHLAERRGLFGVCRSFHGPRKGRDGASDASAKCGFQAIGRAANLLPDGGDGAAKARMVLVTV